MPDLPLDKTYGQWSRQVPCPCLKWGFIINTQLKRCLSSHTWKRRTGYFSRHLTPQTVRNAIGAVWKLESLPSLFLSNSNLPMSFIVCVFSASTDNKMTPSEAAAKRLHPIRKLGRENSFCRAAHDSSSLLHHQAHANNKLDFQRHYLKRNFEAENPIMSNFNGGSAQVMEESLNSHNLQIVKSEV